MLRPVLIATAVFAIGFFGIWVTGITFGDNCIPVREVGGVEQTGLGWPPGTLDCNQLRGGEVVSTTQLVPWPEYEFWAAFGLVFAVGFEVLFRISMWISKRKRG